jgi:hypothetical protein
MSTAGLEQILAQLSDTKLWPQMPKSAEHFEQLALREFKLAAQMDCLAARRALAAKSLRAGKNVKSSELRQISEQMQDIAEDFKQLWLLRNKVSRLRDNLRLFQQAQQELQRLI